MDTVFEIANALQSLTSRLRHRGVYLLLGQLLALLVATANLAAQGLRSRLESEGDKAWTERRYPAAKDAYARLLASDSATSRAVYRLAVLHSWDGALPQAIPLFQRYIAMEPRDEEGRVALGKAYAWAGQTQNAVAVYDSILGRDATYRDAALGAAQALGWAGRFREALDRYAQWLEANPKDVEAELARARTMTWAGDLVGAEREYERISAGGERLEASKGAALVAAWRGHLYRSEGLWRSLLKRYPKDAEVWVGLAQVLRWSGRPVEARSALDAALAVDPTNSDAREQRRWVEADLATAIAPDVATGWDSDGNRSYTAGARWSSRPTRRTSASVGYQRRIASLGPSRATSEGVRGRLVWFPTRRLTLGGELGAVRLRADDVVPSSASGRNTMVGAASATFRLTPGFSLGGSAGREAFDETAPLIRAGLTVNSYHVEGGVEFRHGLSMSAYAQRAEVEGGAVPNSRDVLFTVLRWRPKRTWQASLGYRTIAYENYLREGYFSPRRFWHRELALRWMPGRDLGWAPFADAALGQQFVRLDVDGRVQPTQRMGGGIAYRPAPGVEYQFGYTFSNVASNASFGLGRGSTYRAQGLSLSARVHF